jgi:hypothetical protein
MTRSSWGMILPVGIVNYKGVVHQVCLDDYWRFMNSFVEDHNGCWIWARKQYSKRPKFPIWEKNIYATHFSWLYHIGEIPADKHLCHYCDVETCVNFMHLWLGTNEQNVQDKMTKGRYRLCQSLKYR